MMLPIAFHPEAKREFDEAIDWYANAKKGLGKRFAKAVKSKFKSIQQTPQMHTIVKADVRKATLKVFPYVILYRIAVKETLIVGVFHSKRDPIDWQSRT